MTAAEPDVLPAFTAALTAAARHHIDLSYDSIRHIRAATEKRTPAELAAYVGGTDHGLALTPARMLWRLRRAAGRDDDEQQELTE